VALMRDAERERHVDSSTVELDARLLERGVDLADARITDEIRPLDVEIRRHMKRRHVRQTAKREQRVCALEAARAEARHAELFTFERVGQHRLDVFAIERDVTDDGKQAGALAERLWRQPRMSQRLPC